MQELEEGVELKEIIWPDDTILRSQDTECGIFVSMQLGQMSLVPWAAYTLRGEKLLVNLANIDSVVVK